MRGKDVGQHAHQPLLHRSPCRRCVATESQTHSSSSRLRSAGYQLKTMYTDIVPCNLWKRMKFRLYMHPKNNTGKVTLATIWHPSCTEHEDIMWDAFQSSEKGSRVYQESKNLL